jgi:hypothetical protein
MRNNHGLFVPGKFVANNPEDSNKGSAAGAVVAAGAQMTPSQQQPLPLPMPNMAHPDAFNMHMQLLQQHHSAGAVTGPVLSEDGAENGRRVMRRGENSRIAANGGPMERMDVVEVRRVRLEGRVKVWGGAR